MLCSWSCTRSCITDTSTPKSAWVSFQSLEFSYIMPHFSQICRIAKKNTFFVQWFWLNAIFCFDYQGGPTLDQRFESYYNYCNLFNYILSKSLHFTSIAMFSLSIHIHIYGRIALTTQAICSMPFKTFLKINNTSSGSLSNIYLVCEQMQMGLPHWSCPTSGSGTSLMSSFIR